MFTSIYSVIYIEIIMYGINVIVNYGFYGEGGGVDGVSGW